MFMRIVTCIILLLAAGRHAYSQSFAVYNYSISEGLPSSEVYEVYQDRKGFIWFATDNGVAKFDGQEMETFHANKGLSDPVVFGFYEDYRDRLWFRSFSGKLCYYKDRKITRYEKCAELNNFKFSVPYSFYCSPENEIWISGNQFLAKTNALGSLHYFPLEYYSVNCKSAGNTYLLSAITPDGSINKLIIDDKKFHIDLTDPFYRSHLSAIKWRNKLYISINNDIFSYDGTSVKKRYTGISTIIKLSIDKNDNLWIGYMFHGAERFSNESFTDTWRPAFLSGKSVTSVLQDNESGLWFTTLENGAYYVPNQQIEKIPLNEKITSVNSTASEVFAGDSEGNITVFDALSQKILKKQHIHGYILTIFMDHHKKIWVGTNTGTFCLKPNLQIDKSLILSSISFSEDSEGDIWSLGGNVVRKINPSGNVVKMKPIGEVYRLMLVNDSLIYMASRIGMQIRNRSFEIIQTPEALSNYKVSNILTLNDSTILITTIGCGFFIYNKRTLQYTTFNSDNNFYANNIYDALIVDSTLWLATEKGLAITRIPQLLKSRFHFKFLTKRSGLVSNKINFLTATNHSVWAFADDGISVIPATSSSLINKNPVFYFKEMMVNNKPVPLSNHIKLGYKENDIQLAFGFISFNNQNILARYKLTGNERWTYSNARKLSFPSVAPGKYKLNLQYSTDNIHWTSSPSLNITISQPWWNEWYTYLGVLALFFILGYFYFRHQQSIYKQKNLYLKIINDHQQKLIQSEIVTRERERNRISKELHDRVGTNLTAIKLMVAQLLKTYKAPQAQDIEDQFQIAISEIKGIIYGLTPPGLERYGLFTGLKNYIGKLSKSIPISISLKTFGNEIHKYDLNIIVFRILQELLTNSIKHSCARAITMHINSFDDILNIVYEDDGIGFSYDPLKNGLGLDNIESRIQSVNGTLKFDSGKFGISYTIDIPLTLNKEVV